MPTHKIATCLYCGTRAALVLTRSGRHELSCASCGAPLHDLKMLKAGHAVDRTRIRPSPLHDWQGQGQGHGHPRRLKKKKKKRKGFKRRVFEEAFDLIEDIFD